MLSLLGAVERVRRERVKGASWSMATLAKAIVEDEEAGRISCSDAGKIAETVRSANRTMAPLWLLADAVEEACRSGSTLGDAARRIIWYIGEARQMLYHKAVDHIPEGSRNRHSKL